MSDTFQADQTVPTLYNGNRLRINKYSSGVSINQLIDLLNSIKLACFIVGRC